MATKFKNSLDKFLGIESVSAHCDIPCGIYDPGPALIAALSVARIMDIMAEKSANNPEPSLAYLNTISRLVMRKEEEAEKVKHEIRIIWGDFFKEPQIEKFPNTHNLVHSIMRKASSCKQEAHQQDARDLVELVNEFAESFWSVKGVETVRKVCPYAPKLEVVYPVL